ncbi:PD-(D/E)XK nuclease family protein [Campylobacter upsaliensis]|uniref:PD-(D/E)XK nuclease family protein n=1 Tax=Campylobacter upsaliensis TaxID=28080 RepID=UPI001077C137|nr:PD-(D/E)XK nuclease family protein [Campylobacter upsaliensis]ECP7433035.1 Dna2/Cas4 domain-containing protein [Campylobacter jejuni]EAB5281456.1 Dna2/Cas4 domain-containing protein [Campylobacter upsaliensis]EAH5200473.1 Dna2/Cas4 domain-containing protein [Campylobacter upsaliensis]EAH5218120.1 Dna2/Cas4 domain-containing protein [Campylobacter upsaliensis]EAH7597665.1 Dna2/Cas4 domain-containing protein [Campylobacter upsaliensis]
MEKNKFDIFVAQNLPKALKKASLQSLGDRASYVGSSDISSCLRKTYLDKTSENDYDLTTLIRFQRGHIAEGIVKVMLDGLNPISQLELNSSYEGATLKAHIDFALENKDEIVIVEVKSVSTTVSEPYLSWNLQVQYQMAMLAKSKSKNIRAFVVAINVNTGWFKSFEIERNEALTQIAFEKAKKLSLALQSRVEPEAEIQLFCGVCPYKATCPLMLKGANELNGELLSVAQSLILLNAKKKELESELDEKKAILEEYMRSHNAKKLQVNDSFITLSNDTTSTSFDTKALQKDNPDLYEELFKKYQKSSQRKGYISVK